MMDLNCEIPFMEGFQEENGMGFVQDYIGILNSALMKEIGKVMHEVPTNLRYYDCFQNWHKAY